MMLRSEVHLELTEMLGLGVFFNHYNFKFYWLLPNELFEIWKPNFWKNALVLKQSTFSVNPPCLNVSAFVSCQVSRCLQVLRTHGVQWCSLQVLSASLPTFRGSSQQGHTKFPTVSQPEGCAVKAFCTSIVHVFPISGRVWNGKSVNLM